MRVFRIVDHNGSSKSIAVLGGVVRVVPVASGLIADIEVVQEGVARNDRALVHEGGAVSPSGSCLEESVPMLGNNGDQFSMFHCEVLYDTYNGRSLEHAAVVELVDDVDLEVFALSGTRMSAP
jgi:hypothetical protein